jgi:hypothetical protein
VPDGVNVWYYQPSITLSWSSVVKERWSPTAISRALGTQRTRTGSLVGSAASMTSSGGAGAEVDGDVVGLLVSHLERHRPR